jgi:hypothetical protein
MRHATQRGNALLEFSLCIVFLLPLLTGMVGTGLILSRSVQTNQISRDAGHMFARWVDFSLGGNQDIIVKLSEGLGMTRNGGNGNVILSLVMKVGDAQCTGVAEGQCANNHRYVVVKRIVIGNSGLRSSNYGTPNGSLLQADGAIRATDYLTDGSVVVPDSASMPALGDGDMAYVSEAFFTMPDLVLPYFNIGGSSYAYSLF